ncbi:hypothetical protein HJC23_001973 [Cyclotella cryptica]|uniref:AB hydrolase-1 domain-containing protein n=1 Tax=Cyclotella cryptica TaxID=29204 RepID=A0ABD3PN73_9STRA|eukprot:CCRYP_012943-RA/>CCRYP_012943-RA protein AED:0.32 eAED:0.32 QI:0/-1/0/1/-1/1/1/0/512
MVFSLFSSTTIAHRIASLRDAEASLLEYAKTRFSPAPHHDPSHHQFEIFDCPIPSPLSSSHVCQVFGDEKSHKLHGVSVINTRTSRQQSRDGEAAPSTEQAPLVLLHGYCNGSLYFYRNFMGLSHFHFPRIYALDMYGWGLSSRPHFDLEQLQAENDVVQRAKDDGKTARETKKKVASAEKFFVESLESWRKQHNLHKMTLAGHSMGGYLSVAYAEKYPQHVERLILLSPVGVPERKEEDDHRLNSLPFHIRTLFKTVRYLFECGVTPGSFLRSLPLSKSKAMVASYILNRLPAIQCEQERKNLGEYLYQNSMLPGSGEYCLSHILTSGAFARLPLVKRIADLRSADEEGMEVHFVFGENDWMDYQGGLETQRLCFQKRSELKKQQALSLSPNERPNLPPRVFVHGVRNAGHLLMLDNHDELNAAIIIAAGGENNLPSDFPKPLEFVCDEVVAAGDVDFLRGNSDGNIYGEAGAAQFFKARARFRDRLAKKGDEVNVDADPMEEKGKGELAS